MSHTPGPWEQALGISCHEITAKPDGLKVYIAQATSQSWGGVGSTEGEANARLIAAAPELLEALQRIVKQREDGAKVSREDWQLATDTARAAIRRATGEAK
jgi:hypothetical protein